jgi:hypothetical protein
MVTVTSRRAPAKGKEAAEREKLVKERLEIELKLKKDNDRIAAIDADLKKRATAAGAGFKIELDKLGSVKVDPGHEAEFKGNVPQVQTEAWLALKPGERKAYEKSGLIKVEPQWGKASGGRVTVKLIEAAK